MILVQNDLMKDPVWYTLVGEEVHTQLHAATRVCEEMLASLYLYVGYAIFILSTA